MFSTPTPWYKFSKVSVRYSFAMWNQSKSDFLRIVTKDYVEHCNPVIDMMKSQLATLLGIYPTVYPISIEQTFENFYGGWCWAPRPLGRESPKSACTIKLESACTIKFAMWNKCRSVFLGICTKDNVEHCSPMVDIMKSHLDSKKMLYEMTIGQTFESFYQGWCSAPQALGKNSQTSACTIAFAMSNDYRSDFLMLSTVAPWWMLWNVSLLYTK